MIRTTVKIEGMMCGMCEAHINDAVQAAFPVKKVASSRGKGETVILSEEPLSAEALRRTIEAAGYTFVSASGEPAEKKGILSGLFRR